MYNIAYINWQSNFQRKSKSKNQYNASGNKTMTREVFKLK